MTAYRVDGKTIGLRCNVWIHHKPYTRHDLARCARFAAFRIEYDYRGSPMVEHACWQHGVRWKAVRALRRVELAAEDGTCTSAVKKSRRR